MLLNVCCDGNNKAYGVNICTTQAISPILAKKIRIERISTRPSHPDGISFGTMNQRKTFLASLGCDSPGQYGHLNLLFLLSLSSDSCAITWPHGIIMGGFWSVVCSFETGQTKIEWN